MARAEMRQRARAGAGDTGDTYLKQHNAPEDVEYYPSRRRPLLPLQREDVPPMMAKTVLDLLHSLGVDDADIRFDIILSGSGIRPLRRRPLLPFVGRTLRVVNHAKRKSNKL